MEEARYINFERKLNGEITILKTKEALQVASRELKILSMNIMENEKKTIENWDDLVAAIGREKERIE